MTLVETSEVASVDGIFNYVLHQEIGRGVRAIVFRATCRRGRLRNRQIAVKKTSLNNTTTKAALSSVALHLTLCHPSIVSLISWFSAPCGLYQVLELCENGNLADFLSLRNPCVLVEEELRGVARSLADALVYLKKERVLHRDIKPMNILLTSEYRLKLSGFSSAVRIDTMDSTETACCGSTNYVSPEILSGQPYSFGTDIWSFGSVLATCLSGSPPFEASTPDHAFDNICRASFSLPDTVSYEARDLILGLLQKSPQDRIPLHRLLFHPFFKPSLLVKPLSAERSIPTTTRSDQTSPTNIENCPRPSKTYPRYLSRNLAHPHPTTSKFPFRSKPSYPITLKKFPLDDITNLYRDHSLDDITILQEPQRIVSAPTVLVSGRLADDVCNDLGDDSRPPTPALTADSGAPSVSSNAALPEMRGTLPVTIEGSYPYQRPPRVSPRAQLKRVLSDPCSSAGVLLHADVGAVARRPVSAACPAEVLMPGITSKATSTAISISRSQTHFSHPSTEKARPGSLVLPHLFSTRRLKPQTHKISRGQLVVLPSKSLLVDFREGERRKGRKGKEVLVISPDGRLVEVYDAPHLSTPCCLAEPLARYSVAQLPAKYSKIYADAASLADQLNSRIPKLVHILDDTKCTLMANGPPGDVEIHMPTEQDTVGNEQGAIHLRLHRGRRTLEISRHISKMPSGRKDIGEWKKKVLPLNGSLELVEEDWLALDGLERKCMSRLGDFLRVCEAAEAVEVDEEMPAARSKAADGRERLERALRRVETQSTSEEDDGHVWSRITSVASSMVVPPRPRKLSGRLVLD